MLSLLITYILITHAFCSVQWGINPPQKYHPSFSANIKINIKVFKNFLYNVNFLKY